MAEVSGISWTDATFNVWYGCTKVSPACSKCYAESWAKRTGLVKWGPAAERRRSSANYWRQPIRWDRKARIEGRPKKVFCASLADVFEDRPELQPWREDLWRLIEITPTLIWQVLTKRPENILRFIPRAWRATPRPNVWFGVTAENEQYATERIGALRDVPNVCPWVSYEPALGPVDWTPYLDFVKWVIVGGESGSDYRPCEIAWIESTVRQVRRAKVACFIKQDSASRAGKQGRIPDEIWNIKEFPQI